jgi:competence protein ComEC
MRKYIYGIVGLLVVANVVIWPHVVKEQVLEVTFFDVGQGDSIFIETPQGHQILIDGGPKNSNVAAKVAQKLPIGDTSLDLVVLTHPDADHVGGLPDVLKQYDVAHIIQTQVEHDTALFAVWQEAVAQEKAIVHYAESGQSIVWSPRLADEHITILYPQANIKVGSINESSIVAQLQYHNNTFLFTGDIPKRVEQELVASGIALKSDVLKVPHHGSKSSSSENFVAAVAPHIAVIQAGKENRYGHPHEEVLSRFGNIPVLRTDEISDIVIQTNGQELFIQ